MSRNWIRKAKLRIGTQGGETIDIGLLRFRFSIFKQVVGTPNSANFRIYNLKKETASKLVQPFTVGDGKEVTLEAGYQDNCGPIFKGTIVYSITGRENPTDTYVDITCADAGPPLNTGHASKTFAPGSTNKDHVDYLLSTWEPDIKKGIVRGLSEEKYPKSVTLAGMSRDFMNEIAKSNDAKWWVDGGNFNLLPLSSTDTFSTVTLNENTGLVGMPQETTGGIILTALINPAYKLNVELILDESKINRGPWADLSLGGQVKEHAAYERVGTNDGIYIVDAIEWRGDTHGQEWYAIMTCHGKKTGSKMNQRLQKL